MVVLLDVNSTMLKSLGSKTGKVGETRLKVAIDALRMLIEQKLLNNAKHEVSIVLFGTADTNNRMHEESGSSGHFSNISVVRSPCPVDLDLFRQV